MPTACDRATIAADVPGWSPGLRHRFALVRAYPYGYTAGMNTFLRTDDFDAWLAGLKDNVARARIVHRIRSAEHGNFGDCEPVGEGVSEMRIHVGPGYRAYYTRRGARDISASAGRGQVVAKARHQTRHRDGAGFGQGVNDGQNCHL